MFSIENESETALVIPNDIGEIITASLKGTCAYIHGEAEKIAGFDIPVFLDGDMGQLELPVKEQNIIMLLPTGEYKCKSYYNDTVGAKNCYLLTLFNE